MSDSQGRRFWADVWFPAELMRHATFDLDKFLLQSAPPDARLPCRIEQLHVEPPRQGYFVVRYVGREADA